MRRSFECGWLLLGCLAIACSSSEDPASGTGGSGGSPSGQRQLEVVTQSGSVLGFENQGVYSYRGIPYAAPPIGARRWKPPAPAEPWAETLSAIEVGDVCPQEPFGGLPIPGFAPNEDCLTLNVDAPREGEGLPVMVWIHGGAFTLGEGLQADGGTAGDLIAAKTGTVVVSMNYRLGQLGFLAHPELTAESPDGASGNYGLMDQVAALRWVERNIQAFGGDPDNVTIFGESAGAFSVCHHLVSPEAAGFFDKAILQSGACERPAPTVGAAEAQGESFAAALGCDGAAEGELACMRAATQEQAIAALPPAPNFGFSPPSGATGTWGPIEDGYFIVEQPSESLRSGRFNQVPTILGFTRDEARLFVWLAEIAEEPLEVTAANYVELIAYFLGGDVALAEQAAEQYPLEDYSEPAVALAAVSTDVIFRCPGKAAASKIASFVTETYLYQFEYPDARFQLEAALPLLGAEPPSYPLGAFHSADIPYVFGYDPLLEIDLTSFETTVNTWAPDTTDETLWLEMLGYFARFAATGDPNGAEALPWPVYDSSSDVGLVLDVPTSTGADLAPLCNAFWADKDYLAAELGD